MIWSAIFSGCTYWSNRWLNSSIAVYQTTSPFSSSCSSRKLQSLKACMIIFLLLLVPVCTDSMLVVLLCGLLALNALSHRMLLDWLVGWLVLLLVSFWANYFGSIHCVCMSMAVSVRMCKSPCLQLPTYFSSCFSDTNRSQWAVIAGNVCWVDVFLCSFWHSSWCYSCSVCLVVCLLFSDFKLLVYCRQYNFRLLRLLR
jgi:hypothetical protein